MPFHLPEINEVHLTPARFLFILVFNTYCQLKLPVIPSRSRSLSDLCLDGPEPPVNVAILQLRYFCFTCTTGVAFTLK